MLQDVEMAIVPFIDAKRATLHLNKTHPVLAFLTIFVGIQLLSSLR